MAPSGLRDEPAFMRWATAETVSLLGSAISIVVLPVLVFQMTDSTALTGLISATRVMPYLCFGLIAGPLADRGDRRRLILGGNVVQGLAVATIPVADLFGVLTVAQVFVAALVAATAFVFSDAAVFGAVPSLVGALASIAAGAETIGPVVAGGIIALVGASNGIWLDTASFFAAFFILRTIRAPFRLTAPPAERPQLRDVRRQALGFIRHHRTLRVLLGIGFCNSMAFGATLGLIVPNAVEHLGLLKDDGRIGFLFAGTGVGSLLGGLVFRRTFRIERVSTTTAAALVLSAVSALAMAKNTNLWIGVALLATFSIAIRTTVTTGITYRQLVTPDELRSSVNAIGRMMSWGGQPFGAAIGALVATVWNIPAGFVLAGALMLAAAVVAARFVHHESAPESSSGIPV
jgi:MFS family permease